MHISVSQGTALVNGKPACPSCGIRPRRPGQAYCKPCHTDYMREWRKGKVQALLTPAEWALIERLREHGADPAGFAVDRE